MRDIRSGITTERPKQAFRRGVATRLRRPADGNDASRQEYPVRQEPKEIEIRLSLPKIKLPSRATIKARGQRIVIFLRSHRRPLFAACVALLLVGLVAGIKALGSHTNRAKQPSVAATLSSSATNQSQTPEFSTILPAGKTIEQLGGWGRVSPLDRDPVFAYSDILSGIHIVVSEQPLPAGFSDDISAKLAQVAKQFGATKKLSSGKNELYLGTAPNGAQSLITTKKGLLVLIRSTSAIGDQEWTNYVAGLE